MKIAICVGTRPEIIKMAPIIRECDRIGAEYIILHTGQHYSYEMDGIFFEELGIRKPDHNLHVGSGAQVYQVGTIILRISEFFENVKVDIVLVEGDTNSVMAAAIAANKMGKKVGHVEAGLRSYDRQMPEEINRILTDHISDYLFAPTVESKNIMVKEGIGDERIYVTGNTIVDELLLQKQKVNFTGLQEKFGVEKQRYILSTIHRLENVECESRIRGIFRGLEEAAEKLSMGVIVALHPRTRKTIEKLSLKLGDLVKIIDPLGYLDFIGLLANAALIMTDSGGLQEEGCSLKIPCVTLRDNTERPESVAAGANVIAGTVPESIVRCAVDMASRPRDWANPFGDGQSGRRIVEIVVNSS